MLTKTKQNKKQNKAKKVKVSLLKKKNSTTTKSGTHDGSKRLPLGV